MDNHGLFTPMSTLSVAIREGELTSVALLEQLFTHIEKYNPEFNAYISLRKAAALEEAKALDKERKEGRYRGPLHGIPVAVKDNIDVAGEKTTMASQHHAEFTPTQDAFVVAQLKAAGAIIIGKLNLHEYAWGISSNSPHFGAVKNPWNVEISPGGSSGGGGAAVAAGMAPIALGTDTAGSIRIPGSACGVVGLKPTYGLVSLSGCFPLAKTLDHIGPMGRSVEDVALLMQAITGHDPNDPSSLKREAIHSAEDYLQNLDAPLKGRVIGVEEEYFFHHLDTPVEAHLRTLLERLEAAGAEIRQVKIPTLEVTGDIGLITSLAEGSEVHKAQMEENAALYGEDLQALYQLGSTFTAVDYLKAQKAREALREDFNRAFEAVDLLLAPTLPAILNRTESSNIMINGAPEDVLNHSIRFTLPANLTGFPALTLPVGLVEGMPVGLQLLGPALGESLLLNVAKQIEDLVQFNAVPAPFSDDS